MAALNPFEVGHHRAHHSSGQAAAYEQGAHLGVGRVDPVAEEVVDEFLGEAADFHVGVHVDVLHEESVGAHHLLDGYHVGMNLAPCERLHGYVEVVGSCARHLKHGGGGETGAAVAVVLYLDVGVFLLDVPGQLREEGGAADSGHVLETDLVGAVLHEVVNHSEVVLHRVDGGVGDGEGGLGDHPGLFSHIRLRA